MELNEAIRKARKELGMSQEKLAELAGIERKQLSVLENGGNVTLATVRKILPHLPNIEPFTLGDSPVAVRRIPSPEEAAQAMQMGLQMLGAAMQTVFGALLRGRVPSDEGARELQDTAKALHHQLYGSTPEEYAREQEKIVVPPQEPLTAKNLAEAITVLTAAAKESAANLRAEGLLPADENKDERKTG